MRNSLSRLGLLLATGAAAVLGFAGTAAAAPSVPSAPDTSTMTEAPANTKKLPVRASTDATTQAFDGACHYFELCLFHLNGFQGSGVDFPAGLPDPTYDDNLFLSPGDGRFQSVSNNARSLFNADPFYYVIGCIDRNQQGMCGYQPPLSGGDLFPDYFLNLESHTFA